MSTNQQAYAAAHYSPLAENYVTSLDHSVGEDLDQIETILREGGAARVLDLGCGGGHVSYRAAAHAGEVVACDVTASMLEAVARTAAERGLANIHVQQAAAESLPFDDASFDFVLCRFTAHHWRDLEAGLREARRVLKDCGRAVFIDVVAPSERVLDTHLQAIELLRDFSHVRNYSVAEWVAALSRSGFAVDQISARKMRMTFPVWIARARTAPDIAAAIRSLQSAAPDFVRRYFAIAEEGDFDLDSATFLTRRSA
ncbi:class I SAM-dependent methyltransferase [Methylocapsa palsarum]|uniref:Methyltransferase domain-containing protein n=1 Tax=Methylocapsa palsarum TaxID=1612308 RepID=A0A1I3XFZ5_9HYPH|nr:class I SAM-dependent methyltransferase [Methylocapsa palsarum]SFK18410.1 Methyltransferase domain-containing protein [Methylocapsa palsarum]